MSLGSVWSRFFGHKDVPVDSIALIANKDIQNPPSLTVVFEGPLKIDPIALGQALRRYHASLRSARVDLAPDSPQVFGLAGWDKHVVRLVGFDAPFPPEALEPCVAPAHYPQETKDQVRQHRSHVILYYAGFDEDPLERYIALAAVAGSLAEVGGGVAVLNEHGRTSLPAALLTREELGAETLEILRAFPLTALFCGFVKYDVENVPGVWMRTYGADVFGLPDFAVLAQGHHEGQQYSDMFNNILGYLRQSGAEMAAGHTMQIGKARYMKVRDPVASEYFLQGPGTVLVAEIIDQSEINTD